MSRNPLFNLVVSTVEAYRHITWDNVVNFVANAPQNYEKWWTQLLKEAPQHIVIETCLILFIVWLLFIRKTVDPKKASDSEKLSAKEIEWLLETWEPEPLVPKLSEKESMLAGHELVCSQSGSQPFLFGYVLRLFCICNR
jgi:serine palmitoyltransferase